jgi:hypothetical protein
VACLRDLTGGGGAVVVVDVTAVSVQLSSTLSRSPSLERRLSSPE